ncbi:MAG: penicillin-binding protein 1A, partial [Gammaproteobacteria bacterium]
RVDWPGLEWARKYRSENALGPKPKRASQVLGPGDLVRVMPAPVEAGEGDGGEQPIVWRLAQLPSVEGALVALDPNDGAIVALNGGFDFYKSKFNRVTQAERQPGSSFKPIVYSAALDKGFTAASVINDAPIVLDDPELKKIWRPENYGRKFHGPTRLRQALYKSRNLVSVRLLRAIGVDHAVSYATRFGFTRDRLPPNLSLSLGTATLTPLELARAYAVFANGGFLIDPHFIDRLEGPDGLVMYEANPVRACRTCNVRVAVSPVVERGTTGTANSPGSAGAPVNVALGAQPAVTGVALGLSDAAAATVDEASINPAQTDGVVSDGESAGLGIGDPAASTRPAARERGLVQPPVKPRDDSGADPQPAAVNATPERRTAMVAPRVIEAADAWVMASMLGDVIQRGTATRAMELGRKDLSGKTGTTNDQMDAWFSGFNQNLVATAWVGFDQLASLGRHENGSEAALPAWMKFMEVALEGVQDERPKRPKGVVSVRIDPRTGLRAAGGETITEYFRSGSAPTRSARNAPSVTATAVAGGEEGGSTRESLF